MLYALRTPLVLAGMVVGFLTAAGLRRLLLAGGGRGPRRGRLRTSGGWSHLLDPFGTLAAVIGGIGWLPPDDAGTPVRRLAADLAAFCAVAALGLAGLAIELHSAHQLGVIGMGDVLHGSISFVGRPWASVAAGAGDIGLACAVLAVVPVPPLPLGTLAWTRLPRSAPARRFAYRLVEEQWGVALVLVLLIVPVAQGVGPLFALVETVGDALLRLAT